MATNIRRSTKSEIEPTTDTRFSGYQSGGNDHNYKIDEVSDYVLGGKSLPSGSIVGTSDSQTLTNKTIDADNSTITNIGDEELKSGINANKIGGGSVSNEIFSYLAGATSNIQNQINEKYQTTGYISRGSNASSQIVLTEAEIQTALGWSNNLGNSINYYTFKYYVERETASYSMQVEPVGTIGDWEKTGTVDNSVVHLDELQLVVKQASASGYYIHFWVDRIDASGII